MNRLAPQHVPAEMLGNLFGSAIVAIPMLIGLVVLWAAEGFGWAFSLASGAYLLLLLLLCFSCLIWPRLSYRNSSWRLDDECLEIHRGVLWKNRIAVPLGRVQHADVSQGPMLRYFGLGKLTIHTAGTSNATIELNGLLHTQALALRDRLVQQTQTKAVL